MISSPPKKTKYISRQSDENGIIQWSDEENQIWQQLYERQVTLLPGRACDQYMQGLDLINLTKDRIPQLKDIDEVLMRETGWKTAEVPALINFTEFFTLLANKQFPVATFIRSKEEFDYLQEPDIFHEIFGHTYGKLGLAANKEDRAYLARLYWFTVEFGLLKTPDGLRIYGGGILSSPGETHYALESDIPERHPLNPIDVLRTPYRIDIMQPLYYVLEDFDNLFDISQMDIMALVEEAKKLGLFEPKFPPKNKLAS
jgi:phenylalanine-4-hydroxylase